MAVRKTFIVVFILLLVAPLLSGQWQARDPVLSENRKSTHLPRIQLLYLEPINFFSRLEAYFNERYGFRQALSSLHSVLKYYLLGVSSTPDVLLGKNDWLFWAQQSDGDPLAYASDVKRLSRSQLRAIAATLNERRNWMQSRGVEYFFMIAPDKSTIYQEHLPAYLQAATSANRITHVVKATREAGFDTLVNPAPRLKEGKRAGLVYHRTDTHWTSYGAYLAYRELTESMRHRFPAIRLLDLPAESFSKVPGAWMWQTASLPVHVGDNKKDSPVQLPGDLARQLGLSHLLSDQSTVPAPLKSRCAVNIDTPYRPDSWRDSDGSHPELGHRGLLTTYCDAMQYTALVVHDSFGLLLVPYLSESFRQVTYVWGDHFDYAQEFIEAVDVDLVIHVHVERHLHPDYIW